MNKIDDIRNLEQIIQDTKEAIIYWRDDPTYIDWLRNELSKCYAKLNKLEQSISHKHSVSKANECVGA
jgi:hypothetical protein